MLERTRSFFDAQRMANLTVIVVVVYVVLWALHPLLILSSSTPTGGDAHFPAAYYLSQHWTTQGLTPWYPGWFAGMPLGSYYFVIPDWLAGLFGFVIPFNVAFKIATVLGSLLMPIAAYTMGKLFRAPNPVPAALAAATLPFLFESSYWIDGGNLLSTLAGEYSFSLSLSLAMVTIGLFARGLREHRGRWLAAVALAATLAAHLLPWLWALALIGILLVLELVDRRGILDHRGRPSRRRHGRRALWFVVSSTALSLALMAWWMLPFATSQSYTSSMGYTNDPTNTWHAILSKLGWLNASGGPAGSQWVVVLTVLAVIAAFAWRDRLGMMLTFSAALSLCAFTLDPQGVIWNERLIPFWFISIYLSAGWLVGATLWHLTRIRSRSMIDAAMSPIDIEDQRAQRRVFATFAVAILAMASVVPGFFPQLDRYLHIQPGTYQVSAWSANNFSGYESKASWPEYHAVMTTMNSLASKFGCGRVMWEYNSNQQRFGTTMALMLFPYWTNNCVDSMEGLYFESSGTTPYHFLNQAELSAAPSNPMVGLDYGSLDLPLGIKHLQMLGVKYYLAFSPDVVAAANKVTDLVPIAVTKAFPSGISWHFYLIADSPTVTPVTNLPNVVSGISSRTAWLNANQAWYLDERRWPVLLADQGPTNWPHTNNSTHVVTVRAGATSVSNINTQPESISFDVTKVGVPILVKTSYYPRWHASGAKGPYRVSPNVMVVVPTSHHVTLTYASTPAVTVGRLITVLALLGGAVALWRRRWWRRPERFVS